VALWDTSLVSMALTFNSKATDAEEIKQNEAIRKLRRLRNDYLAHSNWLIEGTQFEEFLKTFKLNLQILNQQTLEEIDTMVENMVKRTCPTMVTHTFSCVSSSFQRMVSKKLVKFQNQNVQLDSLVSDLSQIDFDLAGRLAYSDEPPVLVDNHVPPKKTLLC